MRGEDESVEKVVAAFIRLVEERGYAALTITDIAHSAGVSRMTFYRKFSSKEAVARQFVESAGARIAAAIEGERREWSIREYFAALFEKVSVYGKLIKELYQANLGQFILSFIDRLLFRTPKRQQSVSFAKYDAGFFAGAFYNVVIEWVLGGMSESAGEMSEKFCALAEGQTRWLKNE